MTPEEINRLKGINFKTGFEGKYLLTLDGTYGLSSYEYGKSSGPANKLPKQTLDAMKTANIAQGDFNPFKGPTTYKDSYHWKKGAEE